YVIFFFFQAEDGIRDFHVTGVQTCALPIFERVLDYLKLVEGNEGELRRLYKDMLIGVTYFFRDGEPFEAMKEKVFPRILEGKTRSEERRVGKECRYGG